jgi:hypothetical protein
MRGPARLLSLTFREGRSAALNWDLALVVRFGFRVRGRRRRFFFRILVVRGGYGLSLGDAVPLGVRAAGARLPLPLSGFLDDNITTRFEEFRNLIDMIRC